MYIWIGCKLPEDFEFEIRTRCLAHSHGLGLDTSGFSLPQHISLKISFDAGTAYPQILPFLEDLLRREQPLCVSPKPITRQGNILWIPFAENAQLRHLHNRLDRELKDRFGIPQHLFDKAFAFHSTLLVGDADTLRKVQDALSDHPLPDTLPVDTFLLGLSETGKSGSYRVVKTINTAQKV